MIFASVTEMFCKPLSIVSSSTLEFGFHGSAVLVEFLKVESGMLHEEEHFPINTTVQGGYTYECLRLGIFSDQTLVLMLLRISYFLGLALSHISRAEVRCLQRKKTL